MKYLIVTQDKDNHREIAYTADSLEEAKQVSHVYVWELGLISWIFESEDMPKVEEFVKHNNSLKTYNKLA